MGEGEGGAQIDEQCKLSRGETVDPVDSVGCEVGEEGGDVDRELTGEQHERAPLSEGKVPVPRKEEAHAHPPAILGREEEGQVGGERGDGWQAWGVSSEECA